MFTGHEPVMLLLHQPAFYKIACRVKSPVQVSHLFLPITKRLHCFYANQAILYCSTRTYMFYVLRFCGIARRVQSGLQVLNASTLVRALNMN